MNKTLAALLTVLCLIGLLTACLGEPNKPSESAPPPEEQETMKAIDTGRLVQKDEVEDRWLITQYDDSGENPQVRAIWFKFTENTVIEDLQGEPLTRSELQVGQLVEAWSIGPIAESYPEQAEAAKLVIQDKMEEATAQKAVQVAISTSETSSFWAVKDLMKASFDEEAWQVELVDGTNPEVAVKHRVLSDGTLTPPLVMSNEVFRLYSPEPELEVGNSITVSGEARVFESSFSWTLEDGHSILAEGHAKADKGAPDWGQFKFDISFDKASNPVIMLVLYVESAKDGLPEHELIIPMLVKEEFIQYLTEQE